MKRIIALLICSIAFVWNFISCEKAPENNEPVQEGFDLMISLPSTIKGGANDVVSVNFYSGKGPKEGDKVSVRGYGRFIYQGFDSTSRKGKLNAIVEVYV
jgi:hypothetical protein